MFIINEHGSLEAMSVECTQGVTILYARSTNSFIE